MSTMGMDENHLSHCVPGHQCRISSSIPWAKRVLTDSRMSHQTKAQAESRLLLHRQQSCSPHGEVRVLPPSSFPKDEDGQRSSREHSYW